MQKADAIVVGGTILPITGPAAEAVAVCGERIAAVGSREDVLAWRGRDTEVVDLGGAAPLPGLVEPHTHPDLSPQLCAWADVSGFHYGCRRSSRQSAPFREQ